MTPFIYNFVHAQSGVQAVYLNECNLKPHGSVFPVIYRVCANGTCLVLISSLS